MVCARPSDVSVAQTGPRAVRAGLRSSFSDTYPSRGLAQHVAPIPNHEHIASDQESTFDVGLVEAAYQISVVVTAKVGRERVECENG